LWDALSHLPGGVIVVVLPLVVMFELGAVTVIPTLVLTGLAAAFGGRLVVNAFFRRE
jgi:hypothetical protein